MSENNLYGAYDAEEMVTAVDNDTYYESGADPAAGNGARHTKFLDLTNGAGGERGGDAPGGGGDEYGEADGSARMSSTRGRPHDDVDAMVDAHMRANPQRGPMRVDPNTPGKVVEAGQEHTGRWTKEEHEAFLSALQMYGKEWKKVAAKVKTRTVVQTRTHAQKYFQKLQKAMESGVSKEDVANVEMGTAPEAKKASAVKKKRTTPSIAAKPPPRPVNITASQLLSNLTTAAQSIQTPTSDSQARLNNAPFGGGAVGLSGAAQAILSRTKQQNSFRPSHGFSTGSTYTSGFGSVSERAAWGASTAMKITAPDPDASIKSGSFPEPSPAACGKRKLAEIAAARMLAGVAAGGKPLLSSAMGGADPDGDATPPPQRSPRAEDAPGLTLSDVPAPPLLGGGARKPMSLQILNPESLGVDYEETQKRRKANGEGDATPWEGQLEALVR